MPSVSPKLDCEIDVAKSMRCAGCNSLSACESSQHCVRALLPAYLPAYLITHENDVEVVTLFRNHNSI